MNLQKEYSSLIIKAVEELEDRKYTDSEPTSASDAAQWNKMSWKFRVYMFLR